jgi:hypothetical protein
MRAQDTRPTRSRSCGRLISADQIALIKKLLADSGQTLQHLIGFPTVAALEQIPAADFQRVVQLLERAKRRAV